MGGTVVGGIGVVYMAAVHTSGRMIVHMVVGHMVADRRDADHMDVGHRVAVLQVAHKDILVPYFDYIPAAHTQTGIAAAVAAHTQPDTNPHQQPVSPVAAVAATAGTTQSNPAHFSADSTHHYY